MTDDDLPRGEPPAPGNEHHPRLEVPAPLEGELPHSDTPAPEEHDVSVSGAGPRVRRRRPERDAAPTPARKGATAALAMFAAAIAAELATLAWVWLSGAGPSDAASAFWGVGGILVAISFFVAPAVALSLPKTERRSFWATGVICAFLAFILWGVTCGLGGGMLIG